MRRRSKAPRYFTQVASILWLGADPGRMTHPCKIAITDTVSRMSTGLCRQSGNSSRRRSPRTTCFASPDIHCSYIYNSAHRRLDFQPGRCSQNIGAVGVQRQRLRQLHRSTSPLPQPSSPTFLLRPERILEGFSHRRPILAELSQLEL